MTDDRSLTPFTFSVGKARITVFCDGTLVAPVGSLYRLGSDQPTPEKFPDAPGELSVNAFLVETDGRKIMIDTGSGAFFGPDHGKLPIAFEELGVSTDGIDDIILTHIHADHSGGLVADGKPVFKNAKLHIGKTEAAFWLADGAADAPHATEKVKGQIGRAHAAIDPYETENRVTLFEDNGDILPGFSASLRAGHTPGHLTIRFENNGETIAFVGDIVHGDSVQFANPAITIDFDYDQPRAATARAAAFTQAADEGYLIAATHLPFPGVGHIRRDGDHYRFEAYRK
ncbi:MBL fold metallo-hydrolase [Agrobacterium sp. rho-13.3]|uniref:MBL fold metallo-hydrolase n=1 Tax=Agrobacterium sp. rho-13.3 TaxID=3072980 RepID=UPI002A14FE73|nr:MBL fold metallo-hydrolase [Agrobacterium sp. rho-13.3]MDX8308007.1 MBL fold metallo-hydrolase [Agrobacterium sp. rho-13.3]